MFQQSPHKLNLDLATEKKDFVILIHELGFYTMGGLLERQHVYDTLEEKGIDIKWQPQKDAIERVINESFYGTGTANYMEERLIFKAEAYYRFLSYLQLVESRESTKAANRSSKVAIAIAVLLTVAQIVMSLFK